MYTEYMARLIEGERLIGFRLAKPNRDHYQDAHPHVGRIVAPEEDVQGHIKQVNIREAPHVQDVLKAADGVNSRSAVVFHAFFEAAEFSF